MGESQHTQNIQTRHWKSFAPAWLCQSLWCLGSTQVKQKTVFSHWILYLNVTKMYQFFKLWWTMKSRYCTIMWNGEDCWANEMNHHQPYWRLVFLQRRWCHVYGRIGMKSFIMDSIWKTRQFQQVLRPSRPRLGSSDSSNVFTRRCTFRFWLISVYTKLS